DDTLGGLRVARGTRAQVGLDAGAPLEEHLAEEMVLRREPAVDRRQRDARPLRDVLHDDRVVAAGLGQLARRVPHMAAALPLFAHPEVSAANRDGETFSSEEQAVFLWDPDDDMLAQLRMLMLNMDAPKHTRYRSLVNRRFTPGTIRKLETHIVEQSRAIVDRV